ncbi:MAG TPA: MIP/aquaporin family protein [Gemmatimonadaceae bacterium]|nr:MIP/aquaporin family protein [Gemmatimonadaceae bacterium]
MSPYVAEFIGTGMLILLGNGVVANVVLPRTKGAASGWIVITAGWGFAVFVGAFCAAPFSGAHLNPAVTLAMAVSGKLGASMVPGYIVAQMLGAIAGAVLVYLFYREHFAIGDDGAAKLACFATAPNIRNMGQALFCEIVGTFALILPIFLMTSATMPSAGGAGEPIGLGSIGLVPVALLVFGIGLSLGGTTGYAINPARDLGPRIAHAFLPIRAKRDSDWEYSWVPVAGPLIGALLAAGVYGVVT